jgi:prepilin-type N-terminal cleavage/methylation domain-containing protein
MSSKAIRPSIRALPRQGFTFVELVVVISIIVALAAIGFPVWGMISTRVKVNATEALVNSVATAITNYQQKTWQWNVGTTAAPNMKMYHIFDLNHFNPAVLNPGPGDAIPDLEDGPNGTRRFFSIDGYMPPQARYTGGAHEEEYDFSEAAPPDSAYNVAPRSANPEKKTDPKPWDVNFRREVLNSGYRGFVEMAQPQIKKNFINKRGQIVDAWGRPLRIAFAAKVYGTQAFGVWSAGLDKMDHLETPSRPSKDDLRSWKTQLDSE